MASFKDLYSFTPRTDYITTHCKPVFLLGCFLSEWNGLDGCPMSPYLLYAQTPAEVLLPTPQGKELCDELMGMMGTFLWRWLHDWCDTEEKMALLFERKS
jgi:hypothetical protein